MRCCGLGTDRAATACLCQPSAKAWLYVATVPGLCRSDQLVIVTAGFQADSRTLHKTLQARCSSPGQPSAAVSTPAHHK